MLSCHCLCIISGFCLNPLVDDWGRAASSLGLPGPALFALDAFGLLVIFFFFFFNGSVEVSVFVSKS